MVGIARCDITPPTGIYHRMWGAATHDQSTGLHRPLTATVLFQQSFAERPSLRHVSIAVDHCLLWTEEMNQLLDKLSAHANIERESLTVFFTHTHGAGLMGLERQELPGGNWIPEYLVNLAKILTESIEDARRNMTAATTVYAVGRCSLAVNRDFLDESRGQYVCGFNPEGATDDTVIVGLITSDAGTRLATIVNYACHPTTLAWENTLISPDYVGALREVLETQTGCPCFFIQGASGDISPREGYVGDVAVADRNGRQLGYAALSALESLSPPTQQFEYAGPVVSGATLGTWKYVPLTATQKRQCEHWTESRTLVPLDYRTDLPNRLDLENDLIAARAAEQKSIAEGNCTGIRDARAMVERATRGLIRVGQLPKGKAYPFPLVVWKIGDAVWIALDGEHYNLLQRILRERFPDVILIIGTLANGSNVWYLPDSESFGKGLYQEDASILAKGCLETTIEAATLAIRNAIDSKS